MLNLCMGHYKIVISINENVIFDCAQKIINFKSTFVRCYVIVMRGATQKPLIISETITIYLFKFIATFVGISIKF